MIDSVVEDQIKSALSLCEAPPGDEDAILAREVFTIARQCAGDYNYPAAEVLGKAAARLLYLASLASAQTAGEGAKS